MSRLIVPLYFVLLAGFGIWAGGQFMEARTEYLQHKQVQATNEAKLAVARARIAEQDRILQRLKKEPAFVEKVLRDRLKYAKPGEYIFRFDTAK
jgi:cell division protein DivIC